jgi:hypothetical protein
MVKYYCAHEAEECENLFGFAKIYLGENRGLTRLFMIVSCNRTLGRYLMTKQPMAEPLVIKTKSYRTNLTISITPI